MSTARVVILDYGFGNVRSAVRALQRVGAQVELSSDYRQALDCDGLVVPGVGAFAACMSGLLAVRGDQLIDKRLAGARAVLGICVGHQVMFSAGVEHGVRTEGLGQWPGTVRRLRADVVPHMGWNTVIPPPTSRMFGGLSHERFYFVHSYAACEWEMPQAADSPLPAPEITWAAHGEPFIAAVENGPLWATQFHPEKSGDAGATLLRNWLSTL